MTDRLAEIEQRWSSTRAWGFWAQGPEADDARDVLWLIDEVLRWRDACGVDHVQRVQRLEGEVNELRHTKDELATNNVKLTREVQRLEKLLRTQ